MLGKKMGGKLSGCAWTNSVHIYDVHASIIHSTAMWNAMEGSGMVSGRFVHRSEERPWSTKDAINEDTNVAHMCSITRAKLGRPQLKYQLIVLVGHTVPNSACCHVFTPEDRSTGASRLYKNSAWEKSKTDAANWKRNTLRDCWI